MSSEDGRLNASLETYELLKAADAQPAAKSEHIFKENSFRVIWQDQKLFTWVNALLTLSLSIFMLRNRLASPRSLASNVLISAPLTL